MLHYLRIAVTALSLTACVLLIALWVRSYRWGDRVNFPAPKTQGVVIESANGRVLAAIIGTDSPVTFKGVIFSRYQRPDYQLGGSDTPFELLSEYSEYGVIVPHWFLISLCAVAATLPWLPWRSPRQFSLRTLLIATTLVAVGLGVIVAAT
jgi:hypothetical protein